MNKSTVIKVLRVLVPIIVIGWLLTTIDAEQSAELVRRDKHWGLLLAGFALSFAAVCLSFFRWYLLVRVTGLSITLASAFRLSFLGYLANFVSVGNVGGDLFKAVFVAREQPQRRAAAVATVFVDRVIGLYALLIVASLTLAFGRVAEDTPALVAIARMTHLATGLGGIAVLVILVPGFSGGAVTRWVAGWPKIGPLAERFIGAIRMYQQQRLVLLLILGMSMVVHGMLAVSMYLLALGLYGSAPTLADHLVIVPLSCVAGALPLTPAGLGSFEIAVEQLYRYVPIGGPGPVSGVLVALAYRISTIAIAAVGVVYYWTSSQSFDVSAQELEEPRS